MCGGATFGAAGCGSSGFQTLQGGVVWLRDTTWEQPATFSGSSGQQTHLVSALKGGGSLRFSSGNLNTRTKITGNNSDFTGQIRLGSTVKTGSVSANTVLEFDAPENLGGARASFDSRSLYIERGSVLAPVNPMVLEANNRGIFVDTEGKIVVTNGTFGIQRPIRMTGSLRKEGVGVLALGGELTFGTDGTDAPDGANNILNVAAGAIEPLTTNGFARLSISFAAGTRLIVDAASADSDVRTFGLFNSYGAFTLPSDGKLRATVVNAPDRGPVHVALCTVTSEAASALAGNIVVDEVGMKNGHILRESITVAGRPMVRFSADFANGTVIIVR